MTSESNHSLSSATDERPILHDGRWYGSDGRSVPYTAGGADDWEPAVNVNDDGQSDPFEGLSDYGKQYLQTQVDEADRAAVAKHVKTWDSGYTKQRQKDTEKYGWTKDINAEPEYIKNSVNLVRRMEADPVGVINQMIDAGLVPKDRLQEALGFAKQAAAEQQEDPALAGLPDNVKAQVKAILDERLGGLEKGVGAAATWITQANQAQQQQAVMARLDADLQEQTKKHPGLDRDMVLGFLSNPGMDMDTAVARSLAVVERAVKAARAPKPGFTMPGNGNAPDFRKELHSSETSDDKVRQAVAEMMRNANGH